ncbi:MAG: hypothetical protein IJ038_01260 [Clostridia bacterium]|nr:hypothetical protein [Clostridia bacterium]
MYNYIKYSRRFVESGNEILRFSAYYPASDEFPEISSFYEALAKSCETWCETKKFPELCETRGVLTPVKRLSYLFEAAVTYSSDSMVCVRTDVSLRQGKRLVLSSFTDAQIWQLPAQTILPPKSAVRLLYEKRGSEKRRLPPDTRAFMTDGAEEYALISNEWIKMEENPQKSTKYYSKSLKNM